VSGFSAAWLALREPFDAAARRAALLEALAASTPAATRAIVDLGAGTGANLRYTAPRIEGAQQWLLVDHDAALLAAAPPALAAWAARIGARAAERGGALRIEAANFSCDVRRLSLDLSAALSSVPLPRGALVTSSALLDLASAAWIDGLVDLCAGAAARISFALTYDGRTVFEPAEAGDEEALGLFNAHQRTDKGFGPALGPEAAAYARRRFAAAGYEIRAGRSDWHVPRGERALQSAILEGWHAAAREIAAPERHAALAEWRRRRAAHIESGRSALRVTHVDMVGWPRAAITPSDAR
jgi:hypothetical protein